MANRFLYLVRHGEATEGGALTEAGRQQARLVGERLRAVPLAAAHHSPIARAVETTELIAAARPGLPRLPSELLGDYLPPVPDNGLPPAYAGVAPHYLPEERVEGAALAEAALARYAVPAGEETHELVVTHNFQIAWFIRHALDAPDWRWLGLNQGNGAVTVILYRPDRPPSLVAFNDMAHLPPELRWTGFPADLRPR